MAATLCSVFLLSLSLLIIHLPGGLVDANEPYTHCLNNTTFATNTTYHKNLNALLSALSRNSTTTAFSNVTVGAGGPDAVYGIFLCRGDVSPASCSTCVSAAAANLPNLCPQSKMAVVFYDLCMLRYSNTYFFGQVDEIFDMTIPSPLRVTSNIAGFNDLLGNILAEVAKKAAEGGAANKFAMKKAVFSPFQTLYALAQCTPELSAQDCYRCLQLCVAVLPSCCGNRLGARVMFLSCYIRYENYMFYQSRSGALSTNGTDGGRVAGKKPWIAKNIIVFAIYISVSVASLAFCICTIIVCLNKRKNAKTKTEAVNDENIVADDFVNQRSMQHDLETLRAATGDFSEENKIGEGGFGPVYKGVLAHGQQMAVKRLKVGSEQGIEQFKTEVKIMANIQHRNLVRLLGHCLEGNEKLLVYEFVPNKSLDIILFDSARELDWSCRCKIMKGIAQGMRYLHQVCQPPIIHLDLKASNVLLDEEMQPKISDFGMARIFDADRSHASTKRVFGTHGYIAPEYLMNGRFSVKSDVYSFGVLMLEIISGKKNNRFHETGMADNLVKHAWDLWRKRNLWMLLDLSITSQYSRDEVIRYIHVGLLCVQEHVNKRPSMSELVEMLGDNSIDLPDPGHPPFVTQHGDTRNVSAENPARSLPPMLGQNRHSTL